jgi:hypothetical protein
MRVCRPCGTALRLSARAIAQGYSPCGCTRLALGGRAQIVLIRPTRLETSCLSPNSWPARIVLDGAGRGQCAATITGGSYAQSPRAYPSDCERC